MQTSPWNYNVVVDLEFTQVFDAAHKSLSHEVIEIGAVKLDAHGRAIESFSSFVQPMYVNFVASDVQHLTGISYSDLSDAPVFPEALREFSAWVGPGRVRMASWSLEDKRQIERECCDKGIEVPANMRCWCDLQKVYPRMMGVGKRRGQMALEVAASWGGIRMNAKKAHRALYDADIEAQLMSSLLTGEWHEQKRALATFLSREGRAPWHRRSAKKGCSASIGSRCPELAGLLASMLADSGSASAQRIAS